MPPSTARARFVEIVSSDSDLEMEAPPVRKRRSTGKTLERRNALRTNLGKDEECDESEEECIIVMPVGRGNKTEVFTWEKQSVNKGAGVISSPSTDEDEVVQGKPKGRMWMKEVRVPQRSPGSRLYNPIMQPSKSLQQTSLLDHFARKQSVANKASLAQFASTTTMAAKRRVQQDRADSTPATAGYSDQSTTPSASTPITSGGASPEPEMVNPERPSAARRTARTAAVKRAAIIVNSATDDESASDFQLTSGVSSPASEPSSLLPDSEDVDEDFDDVEEELSDVPQVVVKKASSNKPVKKVKASAIDKSVTRVSVGVLEDDAIGQRIDDPNEKPRPLENDFGSGLDLTLAPMSNISDIFADLTKNALNVKGKNADVDIKNMTKTKRDALLEKFPHDLNDVLDHLNGAQLRVATMCSALKPLGKTLEIKHLFSAEIVPHKQAYIERNFNPPIIFRDITEMSNPDVKEATTAYGAKVEIPGQVDLLVTGFSCVDHSNLNNNKEGTRTDETKSGKTAGKPANNKDHNPKKPDKTPSESGDTMKAMLAYIGKFRPRIVIIENVAGAPWSTLGELLAELDYASCHARVDTKTYYIPHTRVRGYMFCVDRRRYKKSRDADIAVVRWKTLMIRLERPASSPVEDFLLSDNDPRLVLGRKELESARGEKGQRKAVDWQRCRSRHRKVRNDLGLGQMHPITNWLIAGSCKGPDYMWADWITAQVERVLDTIDINFLRTMIGREFDNQFKARIIDLSQNVDRNKDATKSGVTPCLTPSGIPFSTLRGGPILGLESLALQGLPIDKLLLNQETQAKLQDLAGNAMTSTVVGAAELAALICGFEILERRFAEEMDLSVPAQAVALEAAHDLQELRVELGAYKPLSVQEACDAAARSARLCTCEDNFGVARAHIQKCADCKHTSCKACGKTPRHNYVPCPPILRISPDKFKTMISTALPMKLALTEVSPDDLIRLEDCIDKDSDFSHSQKKAAKEAVRRAFRSELRFCSQADRSEVWTFSYDSEYAHLDLIISSEQVDWQFFAKVPSTEPVNSPIRKLLAEPISRMLAAGPDLTKGEWKLRLPECFKFTAVVQGQGPPEFSFGHNVGLEACQGSKVHSQYSITVDKSVRDRLGIEVGGVYKLLPFCGTASGALHVQSETAHSPVPLFMFLDPDRLGHPKDDKFIISQDKRRLVKGKRPCIVRLDCRWRPQTFKEELLDDGSVKRSGHDVFQKGTGDNVFYVEKLLEYRDKSENVQFHADGEWIELPKAKIVPSNDMNRIQRANSHFKVRAFAGSCQSAHIVLRCEAYVQEGELLSWKNRSVIDKVNELSFFGAFTWLTEKARKFSEISEWQTVQDCSPICEKCCPKSPRIMWRLDKDGKLVPFEDHKEATFFEGDLRKRPSPMNTQISVEESGRVELTLSVNPETLMQQAASTICTSADDLDKVKMTWRLFTDDNASVAASFPVLKLMNNQANLRANQPPSFRKYPLRDDQLRSLKWMMDLERNPSPFFEEEVEESVVRQLGWRLEGRAVKETTVRGGVLADQVGFGKTATTLGLIDTHREQDAAAARTPVYGRIASKATLILVPRHLTGQWKSEVTKFLGGSYRYEVLVINTTAELKKLSISKFQSADIIIVSWAVCETDAYLFKVAQFAGINELPSRWSDRVGSAWYQRALSEMVPHVEDLKNGGKNLQKMVAEKLRDDQKAAADANADTYVPSKRLTGAQYRKAKLSAAEKKRKRDKEDVDGEEVEEVNPINVKRETAQKREDDFKLERLAKGTWQWTQMPFPLLEMFHFARTVVDEYTYANGNEGMVIANLQAHCHWILSGTPPMEDFADVKMISKYLGINLGVDDMTPGVTKAVNSKKLLKDLTNSEKFHSYRVSHSPAWHQNRHHVAQRFLDHFVRQNYVDWSSIPHTRHWMPVTLPAAERAIYLELQSIIAANGGIKILDTEKKNLDDRERRIQESFRSSLNNSDAGEALIKSASHFTVGYSGRDHAQLDALDIILDVRNAEYDSLCAQFRDQAAQAKAIQDALPDECRQYSHWRFSISAAEFGDKETSDDMKNLLKSVHQHTDSLVSKNEINIQHLRNLTNDLTKRAVKLINAKGALRLFESIRSFQIGAEYKACCSICQNQNLSLDSTLILVECGHIICDKCLDADAKRLDKTVEACPVPRCLANNLAHQSIRAREFQYKDSSIGTTQYSGKKLEDLVDLIKRIPDGEQVLLFVQYVDLIEKVSEMLHCRGIKYTSLSESDDPSALLQQFQNDKSSKCSRVLILNIGDASAAGSNLTNANHVVFLSPYYVDSAQVYKQAMTQAEARSRRHGQDKHVHIYHFVALQTIDVDIIETREEKTLNEGVAQSRDQKIPFDGFVPSCFGLTRRRNGQLQGSFRSESSTCIDDI